MALFRVCSRIAQLDEETWKKITKWIVVKARQKHKMRGLKCRKDSMVGRGEPTVPDGWGDLDRRDPGGSSGGEEGRGEGVAWGVGVSSSS